MVNYNVNINSREILRLKCSHIYILHIPTMRRFYLTLFLPILIEEAINTYGNSVLNTVVIHSYNNKVFFYHLIPKLSVRFGKN